MPRLRRHKRGVLAVSLLLLTACTGTDSNRSETGLSSCTPQRLETVTKGRLTLSTGSVTRAPWVAGGDKGVNGDPRAGRGYDAAVGVALAQRLGYSVDDVTWVGTPFPEAIAAGEKLFDVNVNQVTIKAERRDAVDISTPYYVMRQAVVTIAGRPAARAASLADLRDVTFATVASSTSAAVLENAVTITTPPLGYPGLDEVRGAVSDGRQAAMVVDFKTATQLDQDETRLVGGTLVGVLPRGDEPAETYGLVLEKGSPLTPCVNAALAALRKDGTLDELEKRWLVDEPGYRLLR